MQRLNFSKHPQQPGNVCSSYSHVQYFAWLNWARIRFGLLMMQNEALQKAEVRRLDKEREKHREEKEDRLRKEREDTWGKHMYRLPQSKDN